MYDILIIGSGICGCFLAHDLAKFDLKIAVLEKDGDVCNETSMANSAIIHAGYDPRENTLKAILNVRGSKMYEGICRDLVVPYKKCGAFVVASDDRQEVVLEKLYRQGIDRDVKMEFLSGDQARVLEPLLADSITKVLSVEDTAIIDPMSLCVALMEEAMQNGVELYLEHKVESIRKENGIFEINTNKKSFQSKIVIQATGVYGDDIASMVEKQPKFTIIPKKGQYFVLSKDAGKLISRVIYPTPGILGKGVLAIPSVDGNLLIGPTNEITDKEDRSTDQKGLNEIRQQICHTLDHVPMQEVIREFSGLRPSGNDGDFLIEESKTVENFIHVACIDSPGLASAPAISKYVMDEIILKKITCSSKEHWSKRRKPIVMEELKISERQKLIKENPQFGNMVCRCEKISEGEIVDAINRPCGAKSIKGIKKRLRPGMGGCQGGVCEAEIRFILAREKNVDPIEIPYDSSSDSMFTHPKGGQ